MADSPILPGPRAWRDGAGKPLPVEFYQFLRDLVRFVSQTTGNTDSLASILARVAALEDAPSLDAEISGPSSVAVFGTLADGSVVVQFANDSVSPGNTYRYGTGPTGAKGWLPVSGDFLAGSGVTLTVGGNGVLTIALSAGSLASLALANTAVQPAALTPYAPLASPTLTTPSLAGLGDYLTDAAAAIGGVPVGGVYRNGSILNIRVT